MRLRHIPGCEKFVAESSDTINNPKKYRGGWNKIFGNENPIFIEIEMGKGRFICDMAVKYPQYNFLGIERYESVLMKAIQRKDIAEEISGAASNCYFLCEDAAGLDEVFAPGEISKIYLNFSDPWPKARYSKRRLTSPIFFAIYDKILKADGVVEFKTDNIELFEFSLESVEESKWNLLYKTYDLHNQPETADNIMTEYEEKFSAKGQKICKLIATRKQKKL